MYLPGQNIPSAILTTPRINITAFIIFNPEKAVTLYFHIDHNYISTYHVFVNFALCLLHGRGNLPMWPFNGDARYQECFILVISGFIERFMGRTIKLCRCDFLRWNGCWHRVQNDIKLCDVAGADPEIFQRQCDLKWYLFHMHTSQRRGLQDPKWHKMTNFIKNGQPKYGCKVSFIFYRMISIHSLMNTFSFILYYFTHLQFSLDFTLIFQSNNLFNFILILLFIQAF